MKLHEMKEPQPRPTTYPQCLEATIPPIKERLPLLQLYPARKWLGDAHLGARGGE